MVVRQLPCINKALTAKVLHFLAKLQLVAEAEAVKLLLQVDQADQAVAAVELEPVD
jgi:hypothetical protein